MIARNIIDVAAPVVSWLVSTYEGGIQGLGDEGMEAAVFDKAVDDGIKRRADGAVGLGGPWGEDILDDSEGCCARTFCK